MHIYIYTYTHIYIDTHIHTSTAELRVMSATGLRVESKHFVCGNMKSMLAVQALGLGVFSTA